MSGLTPFNRGRAIGGFDNFYNMIDNFFADGIPSMRFPDTFKINLKDEEKQYVIDAEMPGIRKEEIQLQLNEGQLDIKVTRSEERKREEKQYIHKESTYSSMSRSVYLPDASSKNIKASLSDGILKIIVPKTENVSKTNRIEIE